MSRLLEGRARILAAFETAGIRAATGGKLAAPCVLVEPGDPWSEPVRMPGRLQRWRLTAIAGKADSEAAFGALGELVDGIDLALRTIDGCQLPAWAKPADISLGNVPYAASVATIQLADGG